MTGDPNVAPEEQRAAAPDVQVQPPFTLPARNGESDVTVGWAILPPQK